MMSDDQAAVSSDVEQVSTLAAAAVSMEENENDEVITASSVESSSLPPPPLPNVAAINNPLMSYFDDDKEEGDDASNLNDSATAATNDQNLQMTNDDEEIINSNDTREIIVSLQQSIEETIPNDNEMIINEAEREGDIVGGMEVSIGQDIGSDTHSSSEIVENNNDAVDNNDSSDNHHGNIDTKIDEEVNDASSNDKTDAQNDDSTTANNIIISSPSVSPPTLPSTTKHDNKQDSNNDNDNTPTLSPGTQTLVAEAERQAAIAAAISANMSSLYNSSPSVAGNIAKVMSIGGTGDGGKSVGAPSPPVALLSGYHHHHHQPTMVALPPPPPPLVGSGHNKQQQHQKQQRQRLMMKPVRFEDVRVAFDDIMNKNNNVGDNQTKGGSDAISSKVDGIHLSETNAAAVVDESTAETAATTTTTTTIDVDTRTEMETPLSSKTTTSTTLIPDSFLRFLLLLANVPIIIEEGEKKSPKHHHQQQTIVSSNNNKGGEESSTTTTTSLLLPKAAIDAAQRTYELYQLAQQTYDSISERQFLSQQDGNRDDATASFFAACSGDIVKVSSAATTGVVDSNDGDDEKKDNIAAGVVVKEQYDGSGSGSTRGGGGSRRLPTAVGVAVNSRNIGQRQGISNNSSSSSRGGVVPPSPPPAMLATATKTTTTATARSSSPSLSIPTTSSSAAAAVASASAVFSNVMSKVTKKQSSFSDIGKKFMSGSSSVLGGGGSSSVSGGGDRSSNSNDKKVFDHDVVKNVTIPTLQEEEEEVLMMEDYEVTIDQEMLGLTVENVLERTIIRTLLPNGAAIHAGAKIGSLIAKVGNVDTSNLTHFETIDELRQSQRPLKLTLRYISSDILRCAREEMGRLIRGRVGPSSSSSSSSATMREDEMMMEHQTRQLSLEGGGESFDSVLRDRWPSSSLSGSSSSSSLMKMSSSSAAPAVMTRAEMIQHAGKDLIRILTLLVVGMEKELLAGMRNEENDDQPFTTKHQQQHLSTKELNEAIEITSKILLEYARGHHSEIEGKQRGSSSATGAAAGRQIGSSFYPVPPGRVQGKKPKGKGKGRKAAEESPLIRIGDALQRTRFFLVETSSITATALRWEIIDYLCTVLDLDTEQELSEKEAASATGGGKASPTNDLGSAGSILKLIVVNCSTSEDITNYALLGDDSSLSLDDQSTRSGNTSHAGNAFISVVHRLAASKSTSARIAACSLGPVLWSHLDFPRQLQLRGVITRALHDVEVIVRKSTAAVLHEIAELVFDRRSVPWLVLMCERSMTDPEPQLRAAAMTLTWHLAEHLPNAFTGDANKGSLSIRRLPPRTDPTFMDVYLLQCKLLPVASNLAEDRIASVRLSVAAQCDRLVNAMGEHWFNIIIDLLQALLSDSDERVRSEATLCMPRFAESVILGTEEDQYSTVLESLMPLALKIQRDSSPLVRSSLATAAGELLIFLVGLGGASHDTPSSPLRRRENSEAPPSPRSPRREGSNSDETGYRRYKKHVDDTFIPILQNLLQDPDPEVTTASLRAVTNASRSSARSSTSTSSCSHNKFDAGDDDLASVASITSLQSHLSVDRTKPVFIPVLSEKQVLRLLPTLSNLATSAQWRVRQSAVEIVPALLGCTHRHETRHEISKLCLTLMGDKVDAVRKTAAECLCLGGSNLAMHGEDDGGEWISKIVVPHLKTCSQSEDAKQRMLSLKMIEIIITNGLCPARLDVIASGEVSPSSYSDNSEVATKESAVRSILSIAASLASDTVPNVRLNVGRVLAATVGLLDRSNAEFAASVLEKQIEEEKSRDAGSDRDVIYFAQQALSISRQHSTLSDLRRESSLMVMD